MHPDHHQPSHEPRDIESTYGKILTTIQTNLRSQPKTTPDPMCKISETLPHPQQASNIRAKPSQSEQRYIHLKPSRMAERDPPEAVRPAPEPNELTGHTLFYFDFTMEK
uniref:Uncharacterized protein n=1 Tax=Caenorhabditis japonica TaxID=281687 RepID=A0A8R1IFP0_CAEJA